MAPTASSRNLFLAAIIALSVYVPFETVAKVSLIVSAFLFVVDPVPPYSRLIAIASCFVVLKLNKYHNDSIISQQHMEEQASMEIVTNAGDGDDAGEVQSSNETKKNDGDGIETKKKQ